jgi:hypothetical protein
MVPSRRWFATTLGAGAALARMPERGRRDSETALGIFASKEVTGAAAGLAGDHHVNARIEGVVQAEAG